MVHLAEMFGVSHVTVWKIIRYRSWKHVGLVADAG